MYNKQNIDQQYLFYKFYFKKIPHLRRKKCWFFYIFQNYKSMIKKIIDPNIQYSILAK